MSEMRSGPQLSVRDLPWMAAEVARRAGLPLGLGAETFGAVAMPLLDAALGISAVAAHVPFAGRAGDTGYRVGPAHDAGHEVAGPKAAVGRRLVDPAQGFVTEHQPLLSRGARAVQAGDDFPVGAAHAERQGANHDGAVRHRRISHLLEARRIGDAW